MNLPNRSKRKISKIRRLLAVHISFNVDKCKFKVKLSPDFLIKYNKYIPTDEVEYEVPYNDNEAVWIPFKVVLKPAPNI
mgnify:CR=1 FL=1